MKCREVKIYLLNDERSIPSSILPLIEEHLKVCPRCRDLLEYSPLLELLEKPHLDRAKLDVDLDKIEFSLRRRIRQEMEMAPLHKNKRYPSHLFLSRPIIGYAIALVLLLFIVSVYFFFLRSPSPSKMTTHDSEMKNFYYPEEIEIFYDIESGDKSGYKGRAIRYIYSGSSDVREVSY